MHNAAFLHHVVIHKSHPFCLFFNSDIHIHFHGQTYSGRLGAVINPCHGKMYYRQNLRVGWSRCDEQGHLGLCDINSSANWIAGANQKPEKELKKKKSVFLLRLLLADKANGSFQDRGAGIESSCRGLTLDSYLRGGAFLLSPGQEKTERREKRVG